MQLVIPIRIKLLALSLIPLLALVSLIGYLYFEVQRVTEGIHALTREELGQLVDKSSAERIQELASNQNLVKKMKKLEHVILRSKQVEQQTIKNIIFVSFGLMFLFLFFNGWISHRIKNSIEKAVSAANKIARGERNIVFEKSSMDETGLLLQSLQDMQKNIASVEQELAESAHQIRTVADSVPASICHVDKHLRFLFCNLSYAKHHQRERDEIIGLTLAEVLEPNRYQAISPFIAKVLTGEIVKEDLHVEELGKEQIIRAILVPDFDEQRKVQGYISISYNVTDFKNTEETLRKSEERFELATKASDSGIWDCNMLTGECYYSSRYKALLCYQSEDDTIPDCFSAEILHDDDFEQVFHAKEQHLNQRFPFDVECRLLTKEGEYRWYHLRAQAVWNAEQEPIRMVGSITDINARKQAQLEVEFLSQTDALTGVFNRRHLMDIIHREIAHSKRYDTPLAVMMLDLDHFKVINDTYGHPKGDKVLTIVSKVLKKYARASDYVCRYGGEEFCILLPRTDLSQATHVAERFREIIEEAHIPIDENKRIDFTCSIGLAAYSDKMRNGETLLAIADEALYNAKQQGRNRVVLASDLIPEF